MCIAQAVCLFSSIWYEISLRKSVHASTELISSTLYMNVVGLVKLSDIVVSIVVSGFIDFLVCVTTEIKSGWKPGRFPARMSRAHVSNGDKNNSRNLVIRQFQLHFIAITSHMILRSVSMQIGSPFAPLLVYYV